MHTSACAHYKLEIVIGIGVLITIPIQHLSAGVSTDTDTLSAQHFFSSFKLSSHYCENTEYILRKTESLAVYMVTP